MIRTIAFIFAFSLVLAAQVHAEDLFPRLGGVLISAPQDYWDPAYQERIASLDVAVISAYPGWGSSRNTSTNEVVKAIHARNPKTRVFGYVLAESIKVPVPTVWVGLEKKIQDQQWWAYQSSSSLIKVLSDYGKETYILNITPYSKADSDGLRFNTWFAKYVAEQVGKPNPELAGLYTDNVFWKPRRDADWNRDDKIDSHSSATVQKWFRDGYAQYIDALRSRMPGKLQIANLADWGDPAAVLTEYQGKFHGGILEGMIGKSYSKENLTDGWNIMMARYRKTMAALAAPKLAIFQIDGDPKDYKTFRYGFASCLMGDAYFAFNDESQNYHGVPKFDEYDAKLGRAVSPPPTKAWSNGVYRRDFENGIALVNPKGNGTREVTLETEFVALKGAQDPVVNNGKTLTKVRLAERDGIILMRKNITKRPAAPQAITIETSN